MWWRDRCVLIERFDPRVDPRGSQYPANRTWDTPEFPGARDTARLHGQIKRTRFDRSTNGHG